MEMTFLAFVSIKTGFVAYGKQFSVWDIFLVDEIK